MRQLIIELGDLYRNQSSSRLTAWVNTLYSRIVTSSDGEVALSLQDINERVIGFAIRDAATQLDMSFKEMRDNALVLPAHDRRMDALQPVVELLPEFFKSLLEDDDSNIKVERSGIVREGDVYDLNSSDEFMLFESKHENRNNAPLAAVVNFSIDGQPGHVLLNTQELENVRSAYIDTKFGGLNPLTKSEWDEIYLACVYRRMFSDDAFASAKLGLSELAIEKWRDAIMLHNTFFKRQAEADHLVRDRYGKVIGSTFKKYDAIAIAKTEQEKQKPVQTAAPAEGKVVCIEERRSQKALEKEQEKQNEVPFDDMAIFEMALNGTFKVEIDAQLEESVAGFDDSIEDYFEEGDSWEV